MTILRWTLWSLIVFSKLVCGTTVGILSHSSIANDGRQIAELQKHLEERVGVKVEVFWSNWLPYQDRASAKRLVERSSFQSMIPEEWETESQSEKKPLPSEEVLDLIKVERSWDEILVAKRESDRFVLWHFLKNKGYRTIGSWKVGDQGVELTSDSFLVIPQPIAQEPFAFPGDETRPSKTGAPWYNDWKVWTIGGGLVAGAVTAFLLANGGEPSGWKVNIE